MGMRLAPISCECISGSAVVVAPMASRFVAQPPLDLPQSIHRHEA
jgi:hypothetical protein